MPTFRQRRRIRGDLATSKDTEVKFKIPTHTPTIPTVRAIIVDIHWHASTITLPLYLTCILYFCRTGLTYKDTFDDLSMHAIAPQLT